MSTGMAKLTTTKMRTSSLLLLVLISSLLLLSLVVKPVNGQNRPLSLNLDNVDANAIEISPTVSPTSSPAPSPSPSTPPSKSNAPTVTAEPTDDPSASPTRSGRPTTIPTSSPAPSPSPSESPTMSPTDNPSDNPSAEPSVSPTTNPTPVPTPAPPTAAPTRRPTPEPTTGQTVFPSFEPTDEPSRGPTNSPTRASPSASPESIKTKRPSATPTDVPTLSPTTSTPTSLPTVVPTQAPATLEPSSLLPKKTPSPSSFSPSSTLCDVCPDNVETGEVQCLQAPEQTINLAFLPNNDTKACGEWEAQGLSDIGIVPFRCNNFIFAVQNGACGGCGNVCPSSTLVVSSTSADVPTRSPSSLPPVQVLDETDVVTLTTKTAESSITLMNVPEPMDATSVEQFESIVTEFFKDHVTSVVDDDVHVTVNYVVVVSQDPTNISTPATAAKDGTNQQMTRSIDLNVLFEVGAKINSSNATDLQQIVDTVLETNLNDLLSRLAANDRYFETSSIQNQATEQEKSLVPEEQDDSSDNSSFFSVWIIASIGVVVISIFVSTMFITRATQRRRRRRRRSRQKSSDDHDFGDTYSQENLSSVAEHGYGADLQEPETYQTMKSYQLKQMCGWRPGGLEVVEEGSETSKSLAGLDYVGSTAGSIASISHASGDGVSTLTDPTFRDKIAVNISDQNEPDGRKLPGLNARMRKRLIEREVQNNGLQAAISMEKILLGTASFSDESNDENTVDLVISTVESERSADKTVLRKNTKVRGGIKKKRVGQTSRGFFAWALKGTVNEENNDKNSPRETTDDQIVAAVHQQLNKNEKIKTHPKRTKLYQQSEKEKREKRENRSTNGKNQEFSGIGARPLAARPKPLLLPDSPESGFGYVEVGLKSFDESVLTTPDQCKKGGSLSPWKHPGQIRTDFVPTPLVCEDSKDVQPFLDSANPLQQYAHQQDSLPSPTYQQNYYYPSPSPYGNLESKDSVATDFSTASSTAARSGVRLVRKGSKLSTIKRPSRLDQIKEDNEALFEMTFGSDSSVIVGSMAKNGNDDSGLELELGHAL